MVSPVSMLLLLSLYWGIMVAFVPHFSQSEQVHSLKFGALLKWLYGSLTFQYLFLAIPIAAGTWVVYRSDMRGRFNFAELFIAALYMASTFLLVDFILYPVELINGRLGNILIVATTGMYGIISISKAFPQTTRRKSAVKLTLWVAVCSFCLFIFLLLFAWPIYGDFTS